MYELIGFFEVIDDIETCKCIGCRNLKDGLKRKEFYNKISGYSNRRQVLFKRGDIITLDKAHKGEQPFTFKKDTSCWITINPLYGRLLDNK